MAQKGDRKAIRRPAEHISMCQATVPNQFLLTFALYLRKLNNEHRI